MSQPLLSLIVPLHNEEAVMPLFFERTLPILSTITEDWEILCVDDGSTDGTYALLQRYQQRDPRIKLVRFSRNFGKEAALSAGIDLARGQAVIPLDADLQDPPELIPQMVEEWRKGYKVVLAVRKLRESDSPLKRSTAHLFYRMIQRIGNVHIPQNAGDFRLMDKVVVQALRRLPERTRFMKGIFAWVGFSTTSLYYERPARAAGNTCWNYWKLWQFALDGITSFSTLPLRLWTYVGGIIALTAFSYGFLIIIKTLFFGVQVPGYASLMATMLFIGGVQLISLGVIGEYLGRVYNESKQRPVYIVERMEGIND